MSDLIDRPTVMFNHVWNSMPWLRCEVKTSNRHVILKAKANRLTTHTEDSGEGLSVVPASVIDFMTSDSPTPSEHGGGIRSGEKIQVRMAGDAEWGDFRVDTVTVVGGTVRVGLRREY